MKFYPFSFRAIFGCTVLPEAGMLVKVINDFIPSNQDQGLCCSHHHSCNNPKQVKQSRGATMSEKKNVKFQESAAFVVYLDQQMGAPHAVCWLKSIF